MRSAKVIIEYPHDPDDLGVIELAVSPTGAPADSEWHPALRDMLDGRRVVWARFADRGGQPVTVWVRDQHGPRRVTTVTL